MPYDASVDAIFAGVQRGADDLLASAAEEVPLQSAPPLEAFSSYLVRIAAADQVLHFNGTLPDAGSQLVLQEGWNWIAPPIASTTQLHLALPVHNYSAAVDAPDVLVTQDGIAVYYGDGYGWGGIDALEPGQGCMLRVADSGTVSYAR